MNQPAIASSIIVTGAGSGIGAATCRRLAAQGVPTVIHTGSQRAHAEQVAGLFGSAPVAIVVGDLADPSTVDALVGAARELGSLRGIVANAGFADSRGMAELDDVAVERSLSTMVTPLARLLRLAMDDLKSAGPLGRVVAVSSFVAHRFSAGSSRFAASAAAKAGIEALVKSAAAELAPHGATANAVAPGYVRKDRANSGALGDAQWTAALARIPMGRLATPDDIAGTIAFLLGADSGYITGQVIHVDGGMML